LIVEIRGALLKNAERWEFKLIHAGVAGAFQQKVWIYRQEEGLRPSPTRRSELRLRSDRRGGVRENKGAKRVVLEDKVMAFNIAAVWATVQNNLPSGLGREWQRAFAGRIVETTEDEAIKGEANLPFGTFHPERIVTFFCSAF
jgi:hypothetical protein